MSILLFFCAYWPNKDGFDGDTGMKAGNTLKRNRWAVIPPTKKKKPSQILGNRMSQYCQHCVTNQSGSKTSAVQWRDDAHWAKKCHEPPQMTMSTAKRHKTTIKWHKTTPKRHKATKRDKEQPQKDTKTITKKAKTTKKRPKKLLQKDTNI